MAAIKELEDEFGGKLRYIVCTRLGIVDLKMLQASEDREITIISGERILDNAKESI